MDNVKYIAFVRCRGDTLDDYSYAGCGVVGLTYEQYSYQLSRPDRGWSCPHCGSSANYLDRESEAAQDEYYTNLEEYDDESGF